ETQEQQRETELLPQTEGHRQGGNHRDQADEHVDQLAIHVIEGAAQLAGGHFHRSRGDHYQAQAEQRQAAYQQRHIQVKAALADQRRQGALHGLGEDHAESLPTASANSRPRSSKLRNMSRLAQAGDSSTASPGSATTAAAATASSRVATRCTGMWPVSSCSNTGASRPSRMTARQ